MATSLRRSILVAAEATYGDIDSTTNLPDYDMTGAIAAPVNTAEITTFGELPVNDRDDVSGGIGSFYGDVATVLDDSGDPVQHRSGEMALVGALEGYGSADDDAAYWTLVLASAMQDHGTPDATSIAITGKDGTQEATVADNGDLQIGGLLQHTTSGSKAEYTSVLTKAVAGEFSYSPALSADLDDGDEPRLCRTFSATYDHTALGKSLKWRTDGHQWREYVAGTRLNSLSITSENRKVMVSHTFVAPHIKTAHGEVTATTSGANIARRPIRTGGAVLHSINCEVILSEPVVSTATNWPRLARAFTLCPMEYSIDINFNMSPFECPSSILPDDMQPNPEITVSLTLSKPIPGLDRDFVDGVYRSLMIGFGPAGAGQGAVIYIPKARMTTDPSLRELGGDKVGQVLTFTSAPDYDGEQAANAGNTAFRIGLTL